MYFMERRLSQQENVVEEQKNEPVNPVVKREKLIFEKALKHLDLKLALKTGW